MGWFENRANKNKVVVIKTAATYYNRRHYFDTCPPHMTEVEFWEFRMMSYERQKSRFSSHHHLSYEFRPMTWIEFVSWEWYDSVEQHSKWDDEDYRATKPYRTYRAELETAIAQAEHTRYGYFNGRIPIVIWPDRRRNMVKTYKRTGVK